MTVGIAAACCTDTANPKIVIAADRMVTSGRVTKIEYEHTETKLRTVLNDDINTIMAVASGDTSLSDDFFHKLDEKLEDMDPFGSEQIIQEAVSAFQDMSTEAINRQVLGGFDMTVSELQTDEVNLDPETVQALVADVVEKRDEIVNGLTVMFGAIDAQGTHLTSIIRGDVARHDSIGYHAIGSGGQPARSSFIRSQYDTSCNIETALLSAVEAKRQSEAAQGVGNKMDIAVVSREGCHDLAQDEIDEVVDLYDEIVDEEKTARENVIEEVDYRYIHNEN